VAIAWALHNPAVTAAIVGARRPNQVRGVYGAAKLDLNLMELAEIESFLRAPGCLAWPQYSRHRPYTQRKSDSVTVSCVNEETFHVNS